MLVNSELLKILSSKNFRLYGTSFDHVAFSTCELSFHYTIDTMELPVNKMASFKLCNCSVL